MTESTCLSRCTLHGKKDRHVPCRLCVTRHVPAASREDEEGSPARALVLPAGRLSSERAANNEGRGSD